MDEEQPLAARRQTPSPCRWWKPGPCPTLPRDMASRLSNPFQFGSRRLSPPDDIVPRLVRSHAMSAAVELDALPIVDFSTLGASDAADRALARELDAIFSGIGF